jgi:hypothetical protein
VLGGLENAAIQMQSAQLGAHRAHKAYSMGPND